MRVTTIHMHRTGRRSEERRVDNDNTIYAKEIKSSLSEMDKLTM